MAARSGVWVRHQLSDAGAVCLDGSPGAFYLKPGDPRRFHIFLEGGGWCYSAADCIKRTVAVERWGSSRAWPPTVADHAAPCGGLCARCDAAVLGELCGFTQVLVKYCDGTSFAGHRPAPVGAAGLNASFNGLKLSFEVRFGGREVLRSTVRALMPLGLNAASDVLLSGCSAGGLAALLAAEWVQSAVAAASPALRRFKVASFSGLFHAPLIPGDTDGGTSGAGGDKGGGKAGAQAHTHLRALGAHFAAQLRAMAVLSDLELPRHCAHRTDPREAHRCLVGTAALEAVRAPTFVAQSTLDSWSTSCILGAGASRFYKTNCSVGAWNECLASLSSASPKGAADAGPSCSHAQRGHLNAWQGSFLRALEAAATLRRAGSGSFVHRCHSHCFSSRSWTHVRVGNVSLGEALRRWWESDGEPAERHTHSVSCLPDWTRSQNQCAERTYCEDAQGYRQAYWLPKQRFPHFIEQRLAAANWSDPLERRIASWSEPSTP